MKMKTLLEKYEECLLNVESLKNLSKTEQKIIIRYEIFEHKCNLTGDITPVLELFKGIFAHRLIMAVWREIKEKQKEIRNEIIHLDDLFGDVER